MGKKPRTKSRGLGDTVEKSIKATGIDKIIGEDCGCEKRKEWLNRVFPYVMKKKGTMNQEQRTALDDFIKRDPTTMNQEDQSLIHSMYNSVFQVNTKPCTSCGAAEWKRMIDKLKSVNESMETVKA